MLMDGSEVRAEHARLEMSASARLLSPLELHQSAGRRVGDAKSSGNMQDRDDCNKCVAQAAEQVCFRGNADVQLNWLGRSGS